MIDPDTRKRILVAAANLRIARDMLPDSVAVNELSALNEYVHADELVLAIDALCNIGESHHCCGGFWRNMERAANSMELEQRAEAFRKRFNLTLAESVDDTA